MRFTVHMEGGWDREGVNICRAEAEVFCRHGGRVGQRGVSIHRDDVYCPNRREGGTERGSTSAELRCTVDMEGGWDREG